MLHDVHPSYIEGLYQRTGQKMPAGPTQKDVRFDFTPAQLEELQQLALEQLADRVALNREGRPSTEEIARSLRENHGVVKYKGVEYAFGGLESALGGATTPEEMLLALYRTGFLSPNRTHRGDLRPAHGQAARAPRDDQRPDLLTASANTSV